MWYFWVKFWFNLFKEIWRVLKLCKSLEKILQLKQPNQKNASSFQCNLLTKTLRDKIESCVTFTWHIMQLCTFHQDLKFYCFFCDVILRHEKVSRVSLENNVRSHVDNDYRLTSNTWTNKTDWNKQFVVFKESRRNALRNQLRSSQKITRQTFGPQIACVQIKSLFLRVLIRNFYRNYRYSC